MLLGLDGLLTKIEGQLAGKIRPNLHTSGESDPIVDNGVGFVNYMAISLLAAIVTAGTAFGPVGGAASGALMFLVAAVTGDGQPQSTRRDSIDMNAMAERFQRLLDDIKARDAATTICAAQQKVEYYGDHFTQLLLRTANFSDVERDLYYDWAYRSIPDTKISDLTTLRAKIATQMQTFAPSATDSGEYYKFAEDALDTNTYGNLFWAMDHMLRQPDVRRFALPEFMLGAGLYAVLAPAKIASDAADGVSITPATYHAVADKLAAYEDAVKATVDDTIKDMHGVIDSNHLAKIPERIEILRFFSDRLFDDPDAMRDPKLTVDIPNEQDSFGSHYPQYWNSENFGREIGPVLGAFLTAADGCVATFRRAAQALETSP
ncbi:MAG: hypothetical protein KDA50_03460 [Rhodobacteraceae bacterium]|nr:hypothetical protein [Paracoccaceae bacterium]